MKNPKRPKADLEGLDLEELAKSIEIVAAGIKKLSSSRLTRKAVLILIQSAAGPGFVNRTQIGTVLDLAERLPELYLKKRKKGGA